MKNTRLLVRSLGWSIFWYFILRIVLALFYAVTRPVAMLDCSLKATRGPFDYGIQPCTSLQEYVMTTLQNMASTTEFILMLASVVLLTVIIFVSKKTSEKKVVPMQPQIPVESPNSAPFWRRKIFFIPSLILLGLIVLFLIYSFWYYKSLEPTTTSVYPQSLVLTYVTEDRRIDNGARGWSVDSLWQTTGKDSTELIANVGKVGEYPAGFVASPDHRFVAVDLERHVQIINLKTKKVQSFDNFPDGVNGITFTSDSRQLIVGVGSYLYGNPHSDVNFMLESIDIQTGVISVIGKGKTIQGDLDPVLVRSDGKVFVNFLTYKDGSSPLGYFDPHTNILSTTTYAAYGLSRDGAVGLDKPLAYIPDNCYGVGDPGLPATMVHALDPITGDSLGVLGRPNEAFSFIAFSPDEQQVLYKTYANVKGCNYKNPTYYLQDIAPSSTPVAVVGDYEAVLRQWNQSDAFVQTVGSSSQDTAIFLETMPIVNSRTHYNMWVVDQYYWK